MIIQQMTELAKTFWTTERIDDGFASISFAVFLSNIVADIRQE